MIIMISASGILNFLVEAVWTIVEDCLAFVNGSCLHGRVRHAHVAASGALPVVDDRSGRFGRLAAVFPADSSLFRRSRLPLVEFDDAMTQKTVEVGQAEAFIAFVACDCGAVFWYR